jgi:hypothetical protein
MVNGRAFGDPGDITERPLRYAPEKTRSPLDRQAPPNGTDTSVSSWSLPVVSKA